MSTDLNEYYFLSSFRFNKSEPVDFGLKQVGEKVFHNLEGTEWIKISGYDFGWGEEICFMKLPELPADVLWSLLVFSDLQENRYSAAVLLERKYPDELLIRLEQALFQSGLTISKELKRAIKILRLTSPQNRCPTKGKSYKQVESDYTRWKAIYEKVITIT